MVFAKTMLNRLLVTSKNYNRLQLLGREHNSVCKNKYNSTALLISPISLSNSIVNNKKKKNYRVFMVWS